MKVPAVHAICPYCRASVEARVVNSKIPKQLELRGGCKHRDEVSETGGVLRVSFSAEGGAKVTGI